MAIATALSFAAPLPAQIGLASSPRPLQLTAVKHGWVSVSLPGSPSPMVTTAWSVPAESSTRLTLVAYLLAPGQPAPRDVAVDGFPVRNAVAGLTEALQVKFDSTMLPAQTPGTHTGTLTLVVVTQ